MILKKPYAFLIKHFKIIHITMFVMFTYLVFALRKIYVFFKYYVQNDNYTFVENMASNYVTTLMIVFLVILLVSAIFIRALMHQKEKPVLYYTISIIYSFSLLIFLIYLRSFFNSLQYHSYEIFDIVILRDISMLFYYVNFFYVGFCFIRGFGFDIKKFNFDFDKKELKIEEGDNEEYELNLNIDKDDVKEYFNRQKRELKYYLQENKMILLIILFIIILFVGGYIALNHFVFNKVYNEKDILDLNTGVFEIKNSYITNKDKNNEIITKNKKYVLVDMNIQSKGKAKTFSKEMFNLVVDGKYYYPVFNYASSFNDLGNVYTNQLLKNDSNLEYLVVFEIADLESKKVSLEILSDKNKYKYEKVALNPQEFTTEEKNIKMNELITIDNRSLKITNYHLNDSTSYKYESCFQDKCSIYTKALSPRIGNVILELEVEEQGEFPDSFYEDYIGITMGYTISSKQVNFLGKNENKRYFDIPTPRNSDILELRIELRNILYKIKMGEAENG